MSTPLLDSHRRQHPAPLLLLRRFLTLFRPYWYLSLLALLTIFAMDLFAVLTPKLLELLIDQALPQRDGLLLALLAFLLFAVPALSGIVGIAKSYLDVVLSQRIMHDLRMGIYTRLQRVSLRFYTSQHTGDILSHLTNDVNGIEDMVTNTMSQALSNAITVALVLVLMLRMNVSLTVLCLVLVPFFLFLSHTVGASFRITSTRR